jgi:hypothetical protein
VTENDGFADTPGRDATPEEEARVTAMLASLRDDDVPMPDHVWSRLSAVIAEEHVAATARQISGEPTALGDAADGGTGPMAAVSVLPTPEQRRRRGAPTWLLGAAAAAVVVLLAGGLIKGLGTGGSSSAGTAMSAAAPSVAASASAESHSNTAYTTSGLAAQAASLVSRQDQFAGSPVNAAAGSGTDEGAVSATSTTPATSVPQPITPRSASAGTQTSAGQPGTGSLATQPLLAGDTLSACLAQLTGSSTATAVAVDRGTYDGKAADVVVVPTENDATQLDVWVLAPGCTRTSAYVLSFARIARP